MAPIRSRALGEPRGHRAPAFDLEHAARLLRRRGPQRAAHQRVAARPQIGGRRERRQPAIERHAQVALVRLPGEPAVVDQADRRQRLAERAADPDDVAQALALARLREIERLGRDPALREELRHVALRQAEAPLATCGVPSRRLSSNQSQG